MHIVVYIQYFVKKLKFKKGLFCAVDKNEPYMCYTPQKSVICEDCTVNKVCVENTDKTLSNYTHKTLTSHNVALAEKRQYAVFSYILNIYIYP